MLLSSRVSTFRTHALATHALHRRGRLKCTVLCHSDASKHGGDPVGGNHIPNAHGFRRSRGHFLKSIASRWWGLMALSSLHLLSARAAALNIDPTPAPPSDSGAAVEESKKEKPEWHSGDNAPTDLGLKFCSGAFMIPHPAKLAKGGEDAYYISSTGRSLGVADGVGGWADVGIDPGEFSRMLMRECRKASESELLVDVGPNLPAKILDTAFQQTKHVTGSSTACIVCLQGRQLLAANLGDSGFMIIRDGKLIFESPSQQHSFNFPFQIGSYGDNISACEVFSVDVLPGDVLVAGSDGLLDNVFKPKIAHVAWEAKERGASPGAAAQQLASLAAARSKDPVYVSPFAKSAREHGFYYQGGKVDDVTVVVAYVVTATELHSHASKL